MDWILKKSKPRTNRLSFFHHAFCELLRSETVLDLEGYIDPNFPDARSDFGDLDLDSTRAGANMQPRCMRPALDVV